MWKENRHCFSFLFAFERFVPSVTLTFVSVASHPMLQIFDNSYDILKAKIATICKHLVLTCIWVYTRASKHYAPFGYSCIIIWLTRNIKAIKEYISLSGIIYETVIWQATQSGNDKNEIQNLLIIDILWWYDFILLFNYVGLEH